MARQTVDARFALRNISWKTPVRAATTASITIATALNNGDTLDGVTLATGDRVLVKNQATGSQNGIYVVGASPARALDCVAQGDVLGLLVIVSEGTANADTAWLCTTNAPITVGTTTLVFVAFGTGGGSSLRVKEIDGAPDVFPVTEIQVTNGTLTDNGGGSVTITITGGAQQFTEDSPRYRFLGTFNRLSQKVSGSTDSYVVLNGGNVDIFSDDGSGDQAEVALSNGTAFVFAWDGTNYAQLDMSGPLGFAFSVDVGIFDFVGGAIRLPRLSADPGSPAEGWTYMNTTTHKARTYDGTTWHDLW